MICVLLVEKTTTVFALKLELLSIFKDSFIHKWSFFLPLNIHSQIPEVEIQKVGFSCHTHERMHTH